MINKKMISTNGVFIAETLKEDIINIDYSFSKVKEYVYGKSKLTVYWM
jgi:16S rRNA G966 N2-methylase RsmD